ncbi:hypothetical protein T484DRAFT_1764081, partial [Baffinella frigidus]
VAAYPSAVLRTFEIAIQLNGQGALKRTTLSFQHLAAGAPLVAFFSPASYFTDGQVPVAVRVAWAAAGTTAVSPHNAVIDFSGGVIANATSLTRLSPTSLLFSFTLPSSPAPRTLTPTLILSGLGEDGALGYSLPFPSEFEFTDPPTVSLSSVAPERARTDVPAQVVLTLEDFPGVASLADIAVRFNDVPAEVVSFARADAALHPNAVQRITVVVRTPCCSSAITPGLADVIAFHRAFPARPAFGA